MRESCYRIPESTVYRNVSNELVVIQLDTGKFFYFSPETKDFLDYFKEPRPLHSILRQVPDEADYLESFCNFLLENKILEEAQSPKKLKEPENPSDYMKPVFLREGEKTLDQITFLCP